MQRAICSVALLAFAPLARAQCTVETFFPPALDLFAGFGSSLAADGERCLAGAPGGSAAGRAFVYERTGGSWQLAQELVASDGTADDDYGYALDLQGDRAIVGAPRFSSSSGRAYIFERQGSSWSETALLQATGAFLGLAVALDGDFAFVSVLGSAGIGGHAGAVIVLERGPSGWSQVQVLTASDAAAGARFGTGLAADAGWLLVGANRDAQLGESAGAVYAFRESGGTWSEVQKIVSMDAGSGAQFGRELALDGTRAVVGAPFADVGGQDHGAAYVLELAGGLWSEVERLVAGDADSFDFFGESVALEGNLVLVGVPSKDGAVGDEGAAYLFRESAGVWHAGPRLLPSAPQPGLRFAEAVALVQEAALVGVPGDDTAGMAGAGAVHVPPLVDGLELYCSCDTSAPCFNVTEAGGCRNGDALGARLQACGTTSVTADDLLLVARDLPANQPGLFYMGGAAVLVPFGNGQRCVGAGSAGIFRFSVQSSGPEASMALGPGIVASSQALFPPPGQVSAGSTWHFQAWYRDPAGPCAGGFNFSDAAAVSFGP